jgi:hypothetical protein
MSQARNQHELFLLLPSYWCLAWLILRPWRWSQHVSPKRRLTFNRLHGVISQKMEFFIITAVRTSNFTLIFELLTENLIFVVLVGCYFICKGVLWRTFNFEISKIIYNHIKPWADSFALLNMYLWG